MHRRFALLVFLTAGCSAPQADPPSLAPRAAEAIDPRLPVEGATDDRPVDAQLAARLAELVRQAQAGVPAFDSSADNAERLVAAAGSARSESWVVAQQALSAAVAARAPITRAMSDIDAITAEGIADNGGIAPANLAAIEAATATVARIDEAQAARIEAMETRLGV